MQQHEQLQFLRALGTFVTEQVRSATAPLLDRISSLEEFIRTKDLAEVGDVLDNTRAAVAPLDELVKLIDARVKKLEDAPSPRDGRDGVDGKDAVIPFDYLNEQLSAGMEMLGEQLNKKISELPKPIDGKDGRDGRDGVSVSVEDVKLALLPDVQEFLRTLPPPEKGDKGDKGEDGKDGRDGTSVRMDDVLASVRGFITEAVDAIPVPRSVVGAVIDRDGDLCIVLSDGESRKLGKVVGSDGHPGKDGENGRAGKDGENGKDGRDGLGFKDMSVTFDGERSFIFRFALEDRVEELSLKVPFMLYRGVWKAGFYERGDCVTRDGSMFVAREDTDKQPGTIESGWQLSTKRGRDGKDGDKGDRGEQGRSGKNGQDLTQLGPDGKKWG